VIDNGGESKRSRWHGAKNLGGLAAQHQLFLVLPVKTYLGRPTERTGDRPAVLKTMVPRTPDQISRHEGVTVDGEEVLGRGGHWRRGYRCTRCGRQ
jgi:hypothetical protein